MILSCYVRKPVFVGSRGEKGTIGILPTPTTAPRSAQRGKSSAHILLQSDMNDLPCTPPHSSRRQAAAANDNGLASPATVRAHSRAPAASVRQNAEAVHVEDSGNVDLGDEENLSSVEPSETNVNAFECCICMQGIATDNIATIDGCKHMFCFVCVTRWSETKSKSLIVLIVLSLRSNTTLTIQFALDTCPLCLASFATIKSGGGVIVHVPDSRSRSRVLEEDTEDEDQRVGELAIWTVLSNIAIVLNQRHSISEVQCLTALRTLERVLQIGRNNNDDALFQKKNRGGGLNMQRVYYY